MSHVLLSEPAPFIWSLSLLGPSHHLSCSHYGHPWTGLPSFSASLLHLSVMVFLVFLLPCCTYLYGLRVLSQSVCSGTLIPECSREAPLVGACLGCGLESQEWINAFSACPSTFCHEVNQHKALTWSHAGAGSMHLDFSVSGTMSHNKTVFFIITSLDLLL